MADAQSVEVRPRCCMWTAAWKQQVVLGLKSAIKSSFVQPFTLCSSCPAGSKKDC
ncbi:hypothetical protein ANANG_G00044030 [Anguilla anguilla]|uniref:Uncharacterized protein n=1 Tax=Anguilla anguilla TaxID=7936 RepID=A0A9D3S514_ANGAN|nr:hypothetical protein ANANG_G00044030 [Anguilla anguilla]